SALQRSGCVSCPDPLDGPERTSNRIRSEGQGLGAVVDLFTPAECANYFKAAGYDLDQIGRAPMVYT
ncbi:MAG: hypothetical protein E5V17_00180, partial [Mesorhizobium sp.]